MRTQNPGLVLLDLMLPDANGITLIEQVPELTDQPIVFQSGFGRDEKIARALDAGAVDYIVKPFSPTELIARLRLALRKRAASDQIALRDRKF